MSGQAAPSRELSHEQLLLDQRTVRKIDVILLPFLAVIFLFNSLDRSNVSMSCTTAVSRVETLF